MPQRRAAEPLQGLAAQRPQSPPSATPGPIVYITRAPGTRVRRCPDDDAFYLFLQKQKIDGIHSFRVLYGDLYLIYSF
jgi:hypothetical protein